MGFPVGSALELKQLVTPANPASGAQLFYPKSDGLWYTKNSAGTESSVSVSDAYTFGVKAQASMTGGGNLSYNVATGALAWDAKFTVIGPGAGVTTASDGYFDILMPTSGTCTALGGASPHTWSAAGITLGFHEALYYILPMGSPSSSVAANFRVIGFTGTYVVPSHWVLIAVRNGDTGQVRWGNDVIMPRWGPANVQTPAPTSPSLGQVWLDTADNPSPNPQGAWSSYTPTWVAATTQPVLNLGTLIGRYVLIGKTCHYRIRLVFGSNTSAGVGYYNFGLPVQPAASHGLADPMGGVTLYRVGTGTAYSRNAIFSTPQSVSIVDTSGVLVTATTFAWAVNDTFAIAGTYEAA